MKRYPSKLIFLVLAGLLFNPLPGIAYEISSRYAKIIYYEIDHLREFNDELYMGRLRANVKSSDTLEEEVVAKLDFIVEKVMSVLDMFPKDLSFSIIIHRDEEGVKADFRNIYKVDVDYIAFYSPSRNTVFYSADNGNLRVVAHEIGHVVAENYFTISPPQRIHEVMAQYAEQHITD